MALFKNCVCCDKRGWKSNYCNINYIYVFSNIDSIYKMLYLKKNLEMCTYTCKCSHIFI